MHMHWAYLAHTQGAASVAHSATTTGRLGIAATLLVVGALFVPVAIVLLIARVAPTRPRRDEGDGDSGRGGGPGGPRRPRGDPPEPDSDPAWWPEFERQFAAHVQRHRRIEPVVASAT